MVDWLLEMSVEHVAVIMPVALRITGFYSCRVHRGGLMSVVTIQQSGNPARVSAF